MNSPACILPEFLTMKSSTLLNARHVAIVFAMFFSCIMQSKTNGQTVDKTGFRIDTDIYSDESKPPINTTQTVFLGNRVIEWDDTNQRLILVDYQDGSLTVADLKAQKKCKLNLGDLKSRLEELKGQMSSEQIATWTSSTQPIRNQLGFTVLGSQRANYQFKTVAPSSPKMASDYADFADWSVRLHAVYPPYKPPLLRMQLNEHLRTTQELPSEIKLSDPRQSIVKPVIARLIVQDRLSRQDQERVRDWEVLAGTLKLVSDAEYFRPSVANGPTSKGTIR